MHTKTICTLLARPSQASNNCPSCIVLLWKHLKNPDVHHPIPYLQLLHIKNQLIQSFIIIRLYMPSHNDDLTLLLNIKRYIVYHFIPHTHPPYGWRLHQRHRPCIYFNNDEMIFSIGFGSQGGIVLYLPRLSTLI